MNVFICHAPADARTASKLALDLLRRGVDVWIDQPVPEGYTLDGEKHAAAMREGIQNAELVIVMISPTAMANPDLAAQIDHAAALGKEMFVAFRQETDLYGRVEKALKDRRQFDFSRANYDSALVELLTALGVNPDVIVNDIVSSMEVDTWLPGTWDVSFTNERAGAEGSAEWIFKVDGAARGIVRSRSKDTNVIMTVEGQWRFVDDRFTIDGVSRLHSDIPGVMMPQNLPYVLSLKVATLERGLIRASSTAGDDVTFRKTGEVA